MNRTSSNLKTSVHQKIPKENERKNKTSHRLEENSYSRHI